LALRLDAAMGPDFLERRFHAPTRDEPAEYFCWVGSTSVARNACGASFPAGSRAGTQRIGAGGVPR
jgi:hypothetical protein